jgi:uncharacterized protein (DUF1778 family)
MPRTVSDMSSRIELRVPTDQKALIARAAALEHVDLTAFILRRIVPEAEKVVERAGRLALSERDTRRVLDLLENPPRPTPRLLRAARSGQTLT